MQSEFDFIETLRQQTLSSSVKTGIGDDCAVISKDSKTDLVITSDLLVEDIDFRLKWTNPEFLGHKSLAVSLSDIAAMGANPVWAMTSIAVPESLWKTDFVEKFYRGWRRLAKKYGVSLIGGDISKSPDKFVIDSIVAGETKKNRAVLRSTANVGDLIFVTGEIGGAACGLKILEENLEIKNAENPVKRQLAPNPQTEIGRILGENDLATAMIDLSDGLSSDLAHLCLASKVGAEIFFDKIPFDKNIPKSFGDFSGFLDGGEDFELLFTVKPKKFSRLSKLLKNHRFSHVGNITENIDIIRLNKGGKIRLLEAEGFRHF